MATKYHLVGDKVTYESDGSNEIYYAYDSSGSLISMNLNGTEYYYCQSRYYVPEWGRWLNADAVVDQTGLLLDIFAHLTYNIIK